MERSWPPIVNNPTGNKPMDEFAILTNNISKVVFSRTLESVVWKSTRLAVKGLEEEVTELKKQPGKNIVVGSPGLIVSLMKLNLIGEYRLCLQPMVLGKGLPLFRGLDDRTDLRLVNIKTFNSGAVLLYYVPSIFS